MHRHREERQRRGDPAFLTQVPQGWLDCFAMLAMTKFFLLLIVTILFSAPAMAACTIEFDNETNSVKSECAPANIIDYLNREIACAYWAGEYPGGDSQWDKERTQNINQEVQKLKCDTLVCDRKQLMNKYADKNEIIAAMEAALDQYIYSEFQWRDEVCKIKKKAKKQN